MKKFINDPYQMVDEMVEAFIQVHSDKVKKAADTRAIVRKDAPKKGKVGIVSGGGSGHKPAFVGFIGQGMLDAVAVGEIFTSPPPNALLEAVEAVDGGKGVLFLLGNYAGDVMNFELAAQLAKARGIEVAQSISTDDISGFPPQQAHMRRGVVGSMFCWKAAGAKAETGGSLAECKEVADRMNRNTRSIGVALGPCTIPAKGAPTFELQDDEIEYGVGHHGEPGMRKDKLDTVDNLTAQMTKDVIADLPFRNGDRAALMINGLGGTPAIELYLAYRKARQTAESLGISVEISLVGQYFTALEMAGYSVTLAKLDEELENLLRAPADTCMFKMPA